MREHDRDEALGAGRPRGREAQTKGPYIRDCFVISVVARGGGHMGYFANDGARADPSSPRGLRFARDSSLRRGPIAGP